MGGRVLVCASGRRTLTRRTHGVCRGAGFRSQPRLPCRLPFPGTRVRRPATHPKACRRLVVSRLLVVSRARPDCGVSEGAFTPGDPTPLDPILALALAPFLAVPGGGAPLDSVAAPVDVPGSVTPSWLGAPVSAAPTFGFLEGLGASPPGGDDVPTAAGVRPSPIGFDLNKVRADFPILAERINGLQIVWFDNAATTQKPQAVIDRLTHFYEQENSNIHRAAHELAARSTDAYERRAAPWRASSEPDPPTRCLRPGGHRGHQPRREDLGQGQRQRGRRDRHLAPRTPRQHRALAAAHRRTGGVIRVIPVDEPVRSDLTEAGPAPRAAHQARGVGPRLERAGTILPVKRSSTRPFGGREVLIDARSRVAHTSRRPTDEPDFFAFSGHKVFGPTGIGALYVKPELLAAIPPWQGGGDMISNVTFEQNEYHPPPARSRRAPERRRHGRPRGGPDYLKRLGPEHRPLRTRVA